MPALYGLREHGTDTLQSELNCEGGQKKMAIGLLKCMATVAGLCESGLYIVRKEGVYHCTTGYAFHKLQLRIYCIA